MKTFIIAEAGSNHNGEFLTALKMIEVAKESGCDAVKFQVFKSTKLYNKETPPFAGYDDVHEIMSSLELPRHWIPDLMKHCEEHEIEFMATPFDFPAVDYLSSLGVKRIKVAGFESTDPLFVDYIASKKIPMIVSVGIGHNVGSINKMILGISNKMKSKFDLSILHCNHSYPTPFEDLNLDTIQEYKKAFQDTFNIKVGFSDHSEGILAPSIAVAKGATVIEKHFTLDRSQDGPDHSFAIEPDELKQMVHNIRLTEQTNSIRTDEFTESESRYKTAMRSVVAKVDIEEGERISYDLIETKRPWFEDSISASDVRRIIGKKAKRNIKSNEIIKKGDLW